MERKGGVLILVFFLNFGATYTIPYQRDLNQCYSSSNFATCKNINLSTIPPELNSDIQSLDLSFNDFTFFPQDWTFFNKLLFLNISYNQLIAIRPPIRNLDFLEQLDLSNNRFKTWEFIDLRPFRNANLKFLDLSYNELITSPVKNQLYISSLEVLRLNNCSLKVLNNNILETLPHIVELHASQNPITLLNSSLSSETLKFLDLSRCNLKLIEKTVIQKLSELNTLLIYQNVNLKKFSCDSESLVFLDISFCNLESVPSGHLPNLYNANFANNHFRIILNGSFANYRELKYLDLSENGLSEIGNSVFNDLHLLEKVDLSSNRLHSLNSYLFSTNKVLTELNLSRNYFTTVQRYVIESLEMLDLSRNEIQNIHVKSLVGLAKLRNLNLSRTEISLLPDYLEGQQVESFDLSDCNIKSVNNRTFAKMQSLRDLDLSGNRLTTTSPDCYENVIALDISRNQWRCDCEALKPMFDWMVKTGKDAQWLTCDSPMALEGLPWATACEQAWHPPGAQDQAWWYTTAVVGAAFLVLVLILGVRRLFQAKERRERAAEQRRRADERDALRRMARAQYAQREERENAPEPRLEAHPPSYNEALLLPKLDASHPSLAGSLRSLAASKQSLAHSANDVRTRPRRKRRRRKSNSSEGLRASRHDSDSSPPEPERSTVLESDF